MRNGGMPMHPVMRPAIAATDPSSARLYGDVLGLGEGRSIEQWIDWDLHGHQLVTHVVANGPMAQDSSSVDGHAVPIPHCVPLPSTRQLYELAESKVFTS